MSYIFILLDDKYDWEDLKIFIDENEAKEVSIKYPNKRVEIFNKSENGYIPTYCYYKNGIIRASE
jgi:hypothetical protein